MMRMTGDIIGVDGNSIGMLNMLEGPNGVMVEVGIEEGNRATGADVSDVRPDGHGVDRAA